MVSMVFCYGIRATSMIRLNIQISMIMPIINPGSNGGATIDKIYKSQKRDGLRDSLFFGSYYLRQPSRATKTPSIITVFQIAYSHGPIPRGSMNKISAPQINPHMINIFGILRPEENQIAR